MQKMDAILCMCEVGTLGKISDCQPEGPRFNPQPGRGLNFDRDLLSPHRVWTGTLSRWSSLPTNTCR